MKMLEEYPVSKIIEPADTKPVEVINIDNANVINSDERTQSDVVEGQGPSAVEMIEKRRANEAARSAARKQMESEVGQTGILGVLSSGTSSGLGTPAVDAFISTETGSGNLEDIISEVDGLATAQGNRERTRLGNRSGGRVTHAASVNELLSGIGPAGSTSIGRKGSISIALESPRVSGSGSNTMYRSTEEISKVISKHNAAIEYCYKRETKLNPNLKGNILVEFVIGMNGRVKRVHILSSTISSPVMIQCMVDRIRGWRFAPVTNDTGDVTVKQKYIFN
jgi:hypothetical protein